MNKPQGLDISKAPPTQEEIDREKDELQHMEERAQKTLYFIPFALYFAVTCIFFALMFAAVSQASTHAVFGLGIAFGLAGAMEIISLMAADKKRTNIKSAMQRLEPISPDHCAHMIHWCETHEEIKMYQNKVADLGRPLTEGEYHAALDWIRLAQNQGKYPSEYQRLLKPIKDTT